MRLRWGLYLATLVVPAMCVVMCVTTGVAMGTTIIDISADTSVVVHTGDTLVFHLLTSNFGVNAAAFGLPVNPTDVDFAFVSAPVTGAGEFAATLESADGSVSVAFGNLTFSPGYFQGSGYAGEVSTLEGYLHLSPLLSEELFSASSAIIALRNEGPDVTVGLGPYLLRQSLFASLSGGPLSVGAIPLAVDLESPGHQARSLSFGSVVNFAADSAVPEPGSGGLLLGGGVLLCGLSLVMARVSHRRR